MTDGVDLIAGHRFSRRRSHRRLPAHVGERRARRRRARATACTRNLSALVAARIRGRRRLPTTLYVTPFVASVRHESTCKTIVPMTDDVPITSSVMIDRSLLESRVLRATVGSGTCRITWREVFEESDRRLALWDFPASHETRYQSGGHRWLGPDRLRAVWKGVIDPGRQPPGSARDRQPHEWCQSTPLTG